MAKRNQQKTCQYYKVHIKKKNSDHSYCDNLKWYTITMQANYYGKKSDEFFFPLPFYS